MPRLLPKDAVAMYNESDPPERVVRYDDVENIQEHLEEIHDLATGLIGALLKLELDSISGPEIGSEIPMVVINVDDDLIRILVDPVIIEEGRNHLTVSALSYVGERLHIDTRTMWSHNPEGFIREMLKQDGILSTCRRD